MPEAVEGTQLGEWLSSADTVCVSRMDEVSDRAERMGRAQTESRVESIDHWSQEEGFVATGWDLGRLIVLGLGLGIMGAPAVAVRMVIVDLVPNDREGIQRVFSFDEEDCGELGSSLKTALDGGDWTAAASAVDDGRPDLASCSGERWISGPADKRVDVWVLYVAGRTTEVKVTFDEVERQTRLVSDVSGLFKALKPLKAEAFAPTGLHQSYELTRLRSVLTIKVTYDAYAVVNDKVDPSSKKAGLKSASLITGPPEHWFVSIDAPVNSVSQLKYNSTEHRLELKETSAFYVGASYSLTDLWSSRGSLVFTGLLTAGKEPLASAGIALGYRFRPWRVAGFELDHFSPFVGLVWTQEDRVEGDGTVHRGGRRKQDVIGGISFNFDSSFFKKADK